jgi:TolB-like protein
LASRTFAKSKQLRRLLQYCVDSTLRGESQELKEYTLGVEVFGRGTDFDPRTDPIVRVDARRLRKKLQDYYASEGLGERIRIVFQPGSYTPQFSPQQTRLVTTAPRTHIAVLPFVNLSASQEAGYIADGITEDIINLLSRAGKLRVIARTTSFQCKGQSHDIQTIRSQLNVGAILEGGFRLRGDKVRVTAQLVDTASEFLLWSGTYAGSLADLSFMQTAIVRKLCEELKAPFQHGGVQKSIDGAAYQLYLKGRYLYNQRIPEGLRKAVDCFEQSIAIDPSFARPYAGLADCYTLMAVFVLRPRDVMPKAKAAVLRAIELDDNLAEAHTILGAVLAGYEWDLRGAEAAFRRALGINPGLVAVYEWWTMFLASIGKYEESIAEIRRARELDPLSPFVNANLGTVLYIARRYHEAIDHFLNPLETDPHFYWTHWHLGLTYIAIQSYASGRSSPLLAMLGMTYGLMGKQPEAKAVIAELEQRGRTEHLCPVPVALVHAALGDSDMAFQALDRAYEERTTLMLWLGWPIFDMLRDDPRFTALLSRLGWSGAARWAAGRLPTCA